MFILDTEGGKISDEEKEKISEAVAAQAKAISALMSSVKYGNISRANSQVYFYCYFNC